MYIMDSIDKTIPLYINKRNYIKKYYNLDDKVIQKLYGKDVYDITK